MPTVYRRGRDEQGPHLWCLRTRSATPCDVHGRFAARRSTRASRWYCSWLVWIAALTGGQRLIPCTPESMSG